MNYDSPLSQSILNQVDAQPHVVSDPHAKEKPIKSKDPLYSTLQRDTGKIEARNVT